jgi:hypothetical protein
MTEPRQDSKAQTPGPDEPDPLPDDEPVPTEEEQE